MSQCPLLCHNVRCGVTVSGFVSQHPGLGYHLVMIEGSLLGVASTNPFSPGFGRVPAALVGRDEMLGELGSGLATGLDDPRWTSILMGVRGTGKTVVLNEMGRRAAASGWVVLAVDASTTGLLERISRAIHQVPRNYEGFSSADLGLSGSRSVEKSRRFRLGLYTAERSEAEHLNVDSHTGVRDHLTYLAREAQQRGVSVLLTVDELHAIDKDEGRRLSNDIQHVISGSSLPLAFFGAGLLEMQYTVLEDKNMTFFRRCEKYPMPPLDLADAISGLRHPIADASGSITESALDFAASAVNGSPYALQTIGYNAWKIADAPNREIDDYAASRAVALSDATMDMDISVPALHELPPTEQKYLAALSRLGGRALHVDVLRAARMKRQTAHDASKRLRLSGYLNETASDTVELSGLVPSRVIDQEVYIEQEPSMPDTGSLGPAPLQPATADAVGLCRKWMPRSRAYCVLKKNHSGRCRSNR